MKYKQLNVPSLASLYGQEYGGKQEAWRRAGAAAKAKNIATMLGKRETGPINSLLEVGAGTGQVLLELSRMNVGSAYTGLEINDERAVSANRNVSSSNVEVLTYDGRTIPFDDKSFDLVYATHVLEHVWDERGFLAELGRVTKNLVYVEVPCELTLQSSWQSVQRNLDIGHINTFTPHSFALRLESSGLSILELDIFDIPFGVIAFHGKHFAAAVKSTVRRLALAAGGGQAAKLLTYHCGALCVPRHNFT